MVGSTFDGVEVRRQYEEEVLRLVYQEGSSLNEVALSKLESISTDMMWGSDAID